jgi:hypothetical protein
MGHRPIDVEVEAALGASKEIDPYLPFSGSTGVNVRRQMVVGIEPKA